MENFDRENHHLYSAQHYFLGKGKDLLIGWLVGRAGADLALAQALAASCTEGGQASRDDPTDKRAAPQGSIESFNHVDKSLEGKVPDIQDQLIKERECLDRSHAEIKEMFRAELSLLQGELVETQDRLNATLAGLQAKIEEKFQLVENKDSDLIHVKLEVAAIAELTTQLEGTIQDVQASATAHGKDIQQIVDSMKSEVTELKTRLTEQQPIFQTVDLHDLEERLQAEINETRQKLTTLEPRDAQLEEIVRAELAATEARDKGTSDLLREELERLNTNLETLDQRITEAVHTLNNHDADIKTLKAQGQTGSQLTSQTGSGLCFNTSSEAPIARGMSDSDGYRREQVQELVRRISAEMESVRAELKENNGRWKICKEAF